MSDVAKGRMIVEVVFADSRTEKIQVLPGDSATKLAREFAREFALPTGYESVLSAQIQSSIAEDDRRRAARNSPVTAEAAVTEAEEQPSVASMIKNSNKKSNASPSNVVLKKRTPRTPTPPNGKAPPSSKASSKASVSSSKSSPPSGSKDPVSGSKADDEEDAEEQRYARALAAFKAQGAKGATEAALKSKGPEVSWSGDRKVNSKLKKPKSTQDATFTRLHKDGERITKRRERLIQKKNAHEDETRERDRYRANEKSQELAGRIGKEEQTTMLSTSGRIHDRLYQDGMLTKEHEEVVIEEEDWACPRCGCENRPGAQTCERLLGFKKGVALADAYPSSWAWTKPETKVGADDDAPRCSQPKPRDLFKPTITAPKSRKLIHSWRLLDSGSTTRLRDVWEELYEHAFDDEPPLRGTKQEQAYTYAPQIDETSRAIVKERQVVDAILDVLEEQQDTEETPNTAARAAYAAAFEGAPTESIHERLFREAEEKTAKIEELTAVDRAKFNPDIGKSRFYDKKDSSQAASSVRLSTAHLRHPRTTKEDETRDKATGQKLYEPLLKTRGPLKTPPHREKIMKVHSALHEENRGVLAGRIQSCKLADEEARQTASKSHVSASSRAMLKTMRHKTLSNVWNAMEKPVRTSSDGSSSAAGSAEAGSAEFLSGDDSTVDESVLESVESLNEELRWHAQCVLHDTADLDFASFCAAMDNRLDGTTGGPKAVLFSADGAAARKQRVAARRAAEEHSLRAPVEKECTFRPTLFTEKSYTPSKPRQDCPIEEVLQDYGDHYRSLRKELEKREARNFNEACTFKPTFFAKKQPVPAYPLSRRYGTDSVTSTAKTQSSTGNYSLD